MSNVPPFGDKQRMVGPGGGGGSGPNPAENAPPEVQESSVLGAVLRYALEDHTHQSPVIFWPQGAGQTSSIVSNRSGFITVTSSTLGATNFCSYPAGSTLDGAAGDYATIGGGRENSATGASSTVAGGESNLILSTESSSDYCAILGGYGNVIDSAYSSVISGGNGNVINPTIPSGYSLQFGYIGGGAINTVYFTGGVAHGYFARSYMQGQMSFSAGTAGSSSPQHSKVVVYGETTTSVDLVQQLEPGNGIYLYPSTAYIAKLYVVASIDGGSEQHVWEIGASFWVDGGGVATLNDMSVVYESSTAGASLWTMSMSFSANSLSPSGTQLDITFDKNGVATSVIYVCGTLKLTEVFNNSLGDIMSKTQAQASMFTELRAPKGFVDLYQGKSASIPIVLSSSDSGLDPSAEDALSKLKAAYARSKSFPITSEGNGISPFLAAGTPVPLYSTVTLLIPGVSPGAATTPPLQYKYILAWRMRTFATAAAGGAPFHGRNSSIGLSNDGSNSASPPIGGPAWSDSAAKRYPIVSSGESMDYVQTEPSLTGTLAQENMYEVVSAVDPPSVHRPIFPGFFSGQIFYGDVSQGITENPSASSSAIEHVCVTRRAYGDELVVMVYRSTNGESTLTWDFGPAGVDANFLKFYGSGNPRSGARNAGIFVTTGVAP